MCDTSLKYELAWILSFPHFGEKVQSLLEAAKGIHIAKRKRNFHLLTEGPFVLFCSQVNTPYL